MSANMFSFRSLTHIGGLTRFISNALTSSSDGIALPKVAIHDIEENPDKRARTLKHLVKANHINHAIIYHNLQFHNHAPHILGSAYLLNAPSEHLTHIYDEESKSLEPWSDSPGEISKEDWREFLGKREYQRGFVDFFEDRLAIEHSYDWRELVDEYLFDGEEPLINGLVCGLAHPLIHLGYAFELSSITLAVEALAMASCFYGPLHKYLDDPAYTTRPGEWKSADVVEVLQKMADDERFEGLVQEIGSENYDALARDEKGEKLMLEYWNAWDIQDPKAAFEQSQRAAVGLLVGTKLEKSQQYDFFIVHVLTSSHAVRILLPFIPAKWHVPLLRQWWLFVVTAYIMQLRPKFDINRITDFDLKDRDWRSVLDKALNSKWSIDAHFVKGERNPSAIHVRTSANHIA